MFLGKLVKSLGQKTPRLKSYRKKLHRGGHNGPPPVWIGLSIHTKISMFKLDLDPAKCHGKIALTLIESKKKISTF